MEDGRSFEVFRHLRSTSRSWKKSSELKCQGCVENWTCQIPRNREKAINERNEQRYILKKAKDRLGSLTEVKKRYNLPQKESSC
jgi:hypothetical protein